MKPKASGPAAGIALVHTLFRQFATLIDPRPPKRGRSRIRTASQGAVLQQPARLPQHGA